MFAQNPDFIKPENYPKLINNELIEWKDIATKSTPIELEKFYKHCYFLFLLCLSIFLLCLR
jgi:hypothetical protein